MRTLLRCQLWGWVCCSLLASVLVRLRRERRGRSRAAVGRARGRSLRDGLARIGQSLRRRGSEAVTFAVASRPIAGGRCTATLRRGWRPVPAQRSALPSDERARRRPATRASAIAQPATVAPVLGPEAEVAEEATNARPDCDVRRFKDCPFFASEGEPCDPTCTDPTCLAQVDGRRRCRRWQCEAAWDLSTPDLAASAELAESIDASTDLIAKFP